MVRPYPQQTGPGAAMTAKLHCDSRNVKTTGKPYAGKPHVRFDEGGQARQTPNLASTLLASLAFSVPSGAPGQAWPFLQVERNLPCKLSVGHVAARAAVSSNGAVGASEGEAVSRSASEPVSASLHKSGVASLPEMMKPSRIEKQPTCASIRLPGVIGDGAQR